MYVIYALVDPRDNTVRYVGVTDDVYKRFLDHINCVGSNFAKNAWIMDLRTANKMVIMETLEEIEDKERALAREGYWIQHYQSLQEPIMNISKTTSPRKAKKMNLLMGKRVSRELASLLANEVKLQDLFVSHSKLAPASNGASPNTVPDVFEESPNDGPMLGPNDWRFDTEQETEFLRRYRKKPQAVKDILRQMNNGQGLSNRYAKYAGWLLEREGLRG